MEGLRCQHLGLGHPGLCLSLSSTILIKIHVNCEITLKTGQIIHFKKMRPRGVIVPYLPLQIPLTPAYLL